MRSLSVFLLGLVVLTVLVTVGARAQAAEPPASDPPSLQVVDGADVAIAGPALSLPVPAPRWRIALEPPLQTGRIAVSDVFRPPSHQRV